VEIKKIHHPYNPADIHEEEIVLILGFFDGVHRGHRTVIEAGIKEAKKRNLKAVVMTFNRHPAIVYKPLEYEEHGYLTLPKRKEKLMADLGVGILYEVDFTSKLGALAPEEFVEQYMIAWNAQVVVAGFDYTYGKHATANMDLLPEYAKERFEVIKVGEQVDQNEKISSTRIRKAISTGNIEEANNLLGYYYETPGYVIHGDARGRELGYPTANITPDPFSYIPQIGVYAVMIRVGEEWYGGMASIGYNITFGQRNHYSIEVNIFDFNQMIYGEDVQVKWISFLRNEVKFNSAEELVEELDRDEQKTKKVLAKLDQSMMR